jgi:ABC-type Fe3+ transport system substrate-binding protein
MKLAVTAASPWRKEIAVAIGFVLVLVGPFLLRPAQSTAPRLYDRRLVIMTPHHELIREEFGKAFARYWKESQGETLFIDWRVAGTSELGTMMKSDFAAAFEYHWTHGLGREWTKEVAASFLNPKLAASAHEARAEFLRSNVSIGVDLFFGGGPYDFQAQSDNGVLVAADARTQAGLAAIRTRHPEWFGEAGIAESVSGETFHDKEMRWCGTCLSSFGIVFNRDVLRRLGIDKDPTQWSDLADPRLAGQLALSDPSKSGSVTKAFEMIIQQQMHRAIAELTSKPGKLKSPAEIEAAGVRLGWERGLQLIQLISANARYFTDSAPKIPLEVAKGDAAAGMCIDFYGRSAEEDLRQPSGWSRVGFVAPAGGTSMAVDPIGLMRGAPEPELAEAFMEWVLSDAGQSLWGFRAGVPGGPVKKALRRLPVRRDFYTPDHERLMSDAQEQPFEKMKAFVYHPEWTGPAFNALRFIVRVTCVDTHVEQRRAWEGIVEASQPARSSEVFSQTSLVGYDAATGEISKVLRSNDKVQEVRLARQLSDAFRRQYELARTLAKEGR